MENKNILLAGVGGQGLVLTTEIISEAAFRDGYDIKSNDVIGLSQRGGKVWGSIRIGKLINSPNIPLGEGDILLAMEPLEGYRWSHVLKDDALVIINTYEIAPSPVLMEIDNYPEDIIGDLKQNYKVIAINAMEEGNKLGNTKVANAFLLGIMAKHLNIKKETWEEVIKDKVPSKAVDENIKAFNVGYNW